MPDSPRKRPRTASPTPRQILIRRSVALASILLIVGTTFTVLRGSGPDSSSANGVAATSANGTAATAAAKAPGPSKGLTPHQLAGQRTSISFTGRTIPAGVRRAVRAGRIGAVTLFAGNLGSRAQIRKLNRQLQVIPRPRGLRNAPLLIMVDQEGGLVKRLAGAPGYSAAAMGARGTKFSRRQGRLTGRNLKNAGINVDLAPVLDVARPGGTIARTSRGFGSTVKRVKKTATAFARGLGDTGTLATAKHFPGLGMASLNTDDAVQRINRSKKKLRRIDMAPYSRYVKAGGDLVMVGTAIYPAFGGKPAAFNRRIVTGELRRRLGFKGVTVTDALGTVAARDFGGPKRVAVAAARAGMDIQLFTDWRQALKGEMAMAKKFRAKRLDRREFRASVNRILRLRRSLNR